MNNDFYVNINDVAKAKGLTSNRALRLEINKPNSKYIARKVKVNGGETYEILYSTLEADVQEILSQMYSGTTALVPANCQPQNFESESAKITALARCDIVKAALNFRSKYRTNKEADAVFLELFNLGQYLPKLHNYVGNISIGTLHRWISKYKQSESAEVLAPNYKYSKAMEYNTIQNDDLKTIAEEAGLDISLKIIMALRGLTIYIPLKPFKKSMERYILAKYDGTKYSINKLAMECEMSQRQVSKIIKRKISSQSCCS